MRVLRIFASTVSGSIYEINADGTNPPVMEKISLLGQSPRGVGSKSHHGTHLGITSSRLVMYSPELVAGRIEEPSGVDPREWFSATSYCVALFLRKEDADSCFRNTGPLHVFDPRWRAQTRETVEAIKSSGVEQIVFDSDFPDLSD